VLLVQLQQNGVIVVGGLLKLLLDKHLFLYPAAGRFGLL
jgi:hypothetical protein